MKIRHLLKSDKTPDCPICISDLVDTITIMSKDCAKLEYEDSLASLSKVKDGVRMLEIQILEIKKRIRETIQFEVKEGVKNKPKPVKPESHKKPLTTYQVYRKERLADTMKKKAETFKKKRFT